MAAEKGLSYPDVMTVTVHSLLTTYTYAPICNNVAHIVSWASITMKRWRDSSCIAASIQTMMQ